MGAKSQNLDCRWIMLLLFDVTVDFIVISINEGEYLWTYSSCNVKNNYLLIGTRDVNGAHTKSDIKKPYALILISIYLAE